MRRKVPRLDVSLTLFGLPLGVILASLFGGFLVLQVVQTLVANIWIRGLVSLSAVVVVYRTSLWINDNYGHGFGWRFLRFITRADMYYPSEPQKEIPLTLSRAGLRASESGDKYELSRDQNPAFSR
ncbi:hypothetical protein [Thermus albus]|uniref:hypothetical protein n=1 Tax=Thermus albus TaxID=2908146 RepID=UPI001FA97EB7|nr:hypothetical protein [Thermus albus]